MSSPELIILDVGHGNCALARDADHAVLIDVPPKWTTIRRTLEAFELSTLDGVFFSHQDRDHFSGAVPLFLDKRYSIARIFVNPDASKPGTATERARVRAAATKAVCEERAHPPEALSTRHGVLEFGSLRVEVLAPSWDVVTWTAAGGSDEDGQQLTGHTLSGVIRVGSNGGPAVLLPGDLDSAGLDDVIEREVDLAADWLVFPHHGGRVGDADDATFAARLCDAVRPQTVVFSHSRTKYHNPLPAIVNAVRGVVDDVRIACTQFSRNCAADLPETDPVHLVDLPAAGRSTRRCCAGTLRLSLAADDASAEPRFDAHRDFISANADAGALCM